MQGESINRIIKKATDFLNLHNSGLEKRSFLAILSIGSLIGALFFFSFSITGNAIGNLDLDNSNLIGLILFAFGLIFSLLYFKSKK